MSRARSNSNIYMQTKAVLIGPSGAGKTTILRKLMEGHTEERRLEIGITQVAKEFVIDNGNFKIRNIMQFQDTSGSEDSINATKAHLKDAQIIILVIDGTSPDYTLFDPFNKAITEGSPEDAVRILAVTRLDLLSNEKKPSQTTLAKENTIKSIMKIANITDIAYCSTDSCGTGELNQLLSKITYNIYKKLNSQITNNTELEITSPSLGYFLRGVEKNLKITTINLSHPDFKDGHFENISYDPFKNPLISYLHTNKNITQLNVSETSLTTKGLNLLKQAMQGRKPPLTIVHYGLEEKQAHVQNPKIKKTKIHISFMGNRFSGIPTLLYRLKTNKYYSLLPADHHLNLTYNDMPLHDLSNSGLYIRLSHYADVIFLVIGTFQKALLWSEEDLQHFRNVYEANCNYAKKILIIHTGGSPGQVANHERILDGLKRFFNIPEVIICSAETGLGIDNLKELLNKIYIEMSHQKGLTLHDSSLEISKLLEELKRNPSIDFLTLTTQFKDKNLKDKYWDQFIEYLLHNKKIIKLDTYLSDLTIDEIKLLKKATRHRDPKLHIFYHPKLDRINEKKNAPFPIEEHKITDRHHSTNCLQALSDTIIGIIYYESFIIFANIKTGKNIIIDLIGDQELENTACMSQLWINQKSLLIGLRNGRILSWNIRKEEYNFRFQASYTGSITSLALIDSGILISGTNDGEIQFWPPTIFNSTILGSIYPKPLKILQNQDEVIALLVLSNGNIVAASYNALRLYEVKITQKDTGVNIDAKFIKIFKGLRQPSINYIELNPLNNGKPNNSGIPIIHYPDATAALLQLPNGDFASASLNGSITIWDINGNEKFELAPEDKSIEDIHGDFMGAASLVSVLGNYLISSIQSPTIKIWDLDKRTCIKSWKAHSSNVTALILLPTGALVSSARSDRAKCWDIEYLNGLSRNFNEQKTQPNPLPPAQLSSPEDILHSKIAESHFYSAPGGPAIEPNQADSSIAMPSNSNSRAIMEALNGSHTSVTSSPIPIHTDTPSGDNDPKPNNNKDLNSNASTSPNMFFSNTSSPEEKQLMNFIDTQVKSLKTMKGFDKDFKLKINSLSPYDVMIARQLSAHEKACVLYCLENDLEAKDNEDNVLTKTTLENLLNQKPLFALGL